MPIWPGLSGSLARYICLGRRVILLESSRIVQFHVLRKIPCSTHMTIYCSLTCQEVWQLIRYSLHSTQQNNCSNKKQKHALHCHSYWRNSVVDALRFSSSPAIFIGTNTSVCVMRMRDPQAALPYKPRSYGEPCFNRSIDAHIPARMRIALALVQEMSCRFQSLYIPIIICD